jgi:MFS family permease
MIPSLAFGLALFANVMFWLGMQALYPPMPLYVASLGGTPTDNGLATLAAAGGAVLSRLFIGALADRAGRKRVMVMGGVIAAITPAMYEMSRSMPGLIAARALSGVGIAAFTTGFQVLLADLAPPQRRGEAFGMGGNSMALAALIGPLIGDWVTVHQGFAMAFTWAATSGVLCAMAALLIREPAYRASASSPPAQALRQALALRSVRAGLAAITPLGAAFGVTMTFWPLVAQQNHLSTIGAFFSVYAIGQLAVQFTAGKLSDRIGRARVMLPGMVLAGIAFALIPVARSDMASLLIAFGCGAGLGIARTAIDALTLDGVAGTLRGTAVALEFTANDVWIGLGSALLGPLAGAAGYSAAYAVVGGACVVTAGLLTMTRRTHPAPGL